MSLKAIDKKTVHQICSGQVVLSLAVAVKELVENALDAGATTIEVRLKECGSEMVEVVDNGSGVEEENFQALTLKHHTSKIQDFSDLEAGVATYGFRGEALSSLCALSDLSVSTCCKTSPVGTKLVYDNNGIIRSKTSCAREVGTTVSLAQLFYTLPVRHKEFQRNKKKEFNKMLQMLHGYCLVCTDVRISCFHQTGKSKKQQVLGTSGNASIRGNIIDVFGIKQFGQLVEFPKLTEQDLIGREDIKLEDVAKFKFSGYISRCTHGHGRSATDRQFYFFNNRPCDHSKLSRLVNEVYHSYNRHQYPCVVLNISTDRGSVDINITPDKRQVMLHHEGALMLLVKVLLGQLFESMQGEYNTRSLTKATPTSCSEVIPCSEATPTSCSATMHALRSTSPATPNLSRFMTLKRNLEPERRKSGCPATKQMKLSGGHGLLRQSLPVRSESDIVSSSLLLEEETPLPLGGVPLASQPNVPPSGVGTSSSNEMEHGEGGCGMTRISLAGDADWCVTECRGKEDGETGTRNEEEKEELLEKACEDVIKDDVGDVGDGDTSGFGDRLTGQSERNMTSPDFFASSPRSEVLRPSSSPFPLMTTSPVKSKVESRVGGVGTRALTSQASHTEHALVEKECHHGDDDGGTCETGPILFEVDSPSDGCLAGPERMVEFDLEAISLRLKSLACGGKMAACESSHAGGGDEGCQERSRFRAKIDPSSNAAAEDELSKEIKKSDFLKMQIIGQFNLGFIVTKLGRDLFIVDQHATDERHNFERLQRDTVIQHQKLLVPKSLEFTSMSESVIINNLKVFEMNGFQFQIDEEAPPMKKLKLTGKPVSKNWSMEKNEIEELVFMLSDGFFSPGEVVRPSCVRAMFASRACRSSVMIGTALRKTDMRKLIDHMAEAEQPWSCPHGRPTMRHLVDLDRLKPIAEERGCV